jgi:LysR family transcriptional regulator, carnitine catabolism transcriptional activator
VTGTETEPAGTLAVASNLSLISHFLLPFLRAFHRAHPAVKLRILNRTSRGIVRAIVEGEADLGIGFLLEDAPDLACGVLHRSPFVLVSPRSADAGKRRPSLAEILDGPLVHFEEGVDLRRHLERRLPGRHALDPVVELPSIDLILRFIADGFGSSILPAFAVTGSWRKSLAVRSLAGSLEPLEILSCMDRRRSPSRAASAFHELLKEDEHA